MRVLNNKGFTLVEVLAVLVILVAIAAIAIPTITSSMERTKEKQNDAKKEMLASYAEEYVEDNKNEIYKNLENGVNSCAISIEELKEKGYIKNSAELDIDGNEINGYIIFDKSNNSYSYENSANQIECSKKLEQQIINIENVNGYFVFANQDKICYDEISLKFVFKDISMSNGEIFYADKTNVIGKFGNMNNYYFCLLDNDINNITKELNVQPSSFVNQICQNDNLYRLIDSSFSAPLLTIEMQLTNYTEGSFKKCS